jgi:hypothetical protein
LRKLVLAMLQWEHILFAFARMCVVPESA